MNPVVSPPPRSVSHPPQKITPSVIQAAPTVYAALPAPNRPDIRMQRQARMVKIYTIFTVDQFFVNESMKVKKHFKCFIVCLIVFTYLFNRIV